MKGAKIKIMKPYGIPRLPELEFPDVADIQSLGLSSHAGRIHGRSGDFRPYIRGANKARTRRYWKRKARAVGRTEINEGLKE